MKRKILLFLIVILSLGLQTSLAQTEKEVAKIRSNVLRTNKMLKTFKKTTKFVDDISLEGTEATYYRSRTGTLKKIQAEIGGETYYAKADYYYADNGELIFIYYVFNRYDTQIGMDPPPKVVKKEEKRLYFKANKMIKKITTITETELNSEAETAEKDILDLEKKFREASKQ